jgi:hypothetical protein
MRLIDAEALKSEMITDLANAMRMQEVHKGDMAVRVLNKIDEASTIDAVPVIYCKDCSYARPLNLRELMVFDSACFVCTSRNGAGTSYPEYEMTGKVVFPKSFCSYAHRRAHGR